VGRCLAGGLCSAEGGSLSFTSLAILGGTFDPVHYGHLRTAQDVLEALNPTQFCFVPLRQAVHREQPQVSAEIRAAMLRAAIADNPRFMVDDCELTRSAPSYTVDTLRHFRQLHPDTQLLLILGEDAFAGFLEWHEPEVILSLAHLIVMQRPQKPVFSAALNALLTARRVQHTSDLAAELAGKILCLPVTQLAISANAIRARYAAGLDGRYLLPAAVDQIIQQLQLYQTHSV